MSEPYLNEYFTLTNDLLFKLVVSSLPYVLHHANGSAMVFSVDADTLYSDQSIGVGATTNQNIYLGAQPVTAWRSAAKRTRSLAADLLYSQSPEIKEIEDALPIIAISFVLEPSPRRIWKKPYTLRMSDFGIDAPTEDKITMVILPFLMMTNALSRRSPKKTCGAGSSRKPGQTPNRGLFGSCLKWIRFSKPCNKAWIC